MRIDPKVLVPITDRKPASDAAAPARSTTAAPSAAASVVKLSSAGAAVQAEPTNTGITARLAKIRSLLDKGEYPVDLDALASRIVDDEVGRAGHATPHASHAPQSGGGGGSKP
jgi:anti-sigma28 factor (negative regulator of flagellin synthesis)